MVFNLNKVYISEELKIYYTEDFNNKEFIDSLDNTCYIFLQFTWNIESVIINLTFDDWFKDFPELFDYKNNIIFCAPDEYCNNIIISKGFNSILMNHNCLIDYNLFDIGNEDKIYNAVINSRPFWWKRVYLANKVENTVYIKGNDWAKDHTTWDGYKNMNLIVKSEINPSEVNKIYQQSKVGLMLSGNTGENQQGLCEGANYSSCEYLLSGLPVITTPSQGGRNFWFDEYNSITCEPNEDDVNNCANIMLNRLENNEIDRNQIRNTAIDKINSLRKNFTEKLQELFDSKNININSKEYFDKIFFNKFTDYNVKSFT
jgi:glycosyltransferase involved in cell wall biosynthesis